MRRDASARRNRLLGVMLAGVGALMFATCIALTILIHYGNAHHLLAGL